MHLFLICKAWRIHYIVIPTSTRVSQILTKHSWSYLILDRFSMQWTYFGMHLTNPPQKIGDCRENQKGTFRLGSVCKGTRLTEGKKNKKKNTKYHGVTPRQGKWLFSILASKGYVRLSHKKSLALSHLPRCPSPGVSWHCQSVSEIGCNSRMLRSSARREEK